MYSPTTQPRHGQSWPVILLRLMLSVFLVTLFAGVASAAPPDPNGSEPSVTPADVALTIDGGWRALNWSGSGQPFAAEGKFTFNAALTVKLKVTDLFCRGDVFRVFDNSVLLGETSSSGYDPGCHDYTTSPDQGMNHPHFSHGIFQLSPGPHAITIQIIQNPYNSGTAYLRVDLDTIIGSVFLDTDADGVHDPAETDGLAGVGVDLTRNGYWYDFSWTIAQGFYQLWGSRTAGAYCVTPRIPPGYRLTSPIPVCVTIDSQKQAPQRADFGVIQGWVNYLPRVQQR